MIFLAVFILNGCSSGEDVQTDDTQQETDISDADFGGTITETQIVTIENTAFTEDTYVGTIAGLTVELVKMEDSKMSFMVPTDIDTGEQLLTIAGLDHIKIGYEIVENILPGTPDEVLSGMFSNIREFETTLDIGESSLYTKDFLERFNQFYVNASAADKKTIALYYNANRDFINELLLPIQLRNDGVTSLNKFLRATAAFGIGVVAAYFSVPGNPVLAIAGTVLAIVAWKKARNHYSAFADFKIKKLGFLIDGVSSEFSNRMSDPLLLDPYNNEGITFDVKERKLDSEDYGSTNENLIGFFESFSNFEIIVVRLNNAIEFINDNVWFANVGFITETSIPVDSPEEIVPAILINDNITFSFDDSNLKIVEVFPTVNGIYIHYEFIDNSWNGDFYVDTNLNFTYEDDFNSFSGFFPVRAIKTLNRASFFEDFNQLSFDNGNITRVIDFPVGGFYETDVTTIIPLHSPTCTNGNGTGSEYDCSNTTNVNDIFSNENYEIGFYFIYDWEGSINPSRYHFEGVYNPATDQLEGTIRARTQENNNQETFYTDAIIKKG